MKRRNILFPALLLAACLLGSLRASGQEIKTSPLLLLAGTPNAGIEWTVGSRFSLNGDVLWMPYMFKKTESVLRALVGSVDLRYYVNPRYYYTNGSFSGFYLCPYAMVGNFNVGFKKGSPEDSRRYVGWGLSAGVSLGYKFYLAPRLRLDLNLGVGYAHLQYDRYRLGGQNAKYALSLKDTDWWVGPTKFGLHLGYFIFK